MASKGNRSVRRNLKIEPRIELTVGEWVEIYYALDTKVHYIKRGDFGPKASERDEWIRYLGTIKRKIGPQGKTAARRGVDPAASLPLTLFPPRPQATIARVLVDSLH